MYINLISGVEWLPPARRNPRRWRRQRLPSKCCRLPSATCITHLTNRGPRSQHTKKTSGPQTERLVETHCLQLESLIAAVSQIRPGSAHDRNVAIIRTDHAAFASLIVGIDYVTYVSAIRPPPPDNYCDGGRNGGETVVLRISRRCAISQACV